MSFLENSLGTTAVSLSMELKKPTYTIPGHHFCSCLNKTFLYSVPLVLGNTPCGYLVLASYDQPILKEMIAVTNLLSVSIINGYEQKQPKNKISLCTERVQLNKRQIHVLQLLACGFTDKAVAAELHICFDTVKYHKKNIFKILKANCTLEAVLKAIKLNVLPIDQIHISF